MYQQDDLPQFFLSTRSQTNKTEFFWIKGTSVRMRTIFGANGEFCVRSDKGADGREGLKPQRSLPPPRWRFCCWRLRSCCSCLLAISRLLSALLFLGTLLHLFLFFRSLALGFLPLFFGCPSCRFLPAVPHLLLTGSPAPRPLFPLAHLLLCPLCTTKGQS